MMNESLGVAIRSAANTHCDLDWRWENQADKRNTFLYWLVTAGHGELHTEEGTFPLTAGESFIMPLWRYHRGEQEVSNRLRVIWMLFEYRDAKGKPAIPSPLPRFQRHIPDSHLLHSLAGRSITAWEENQRETANHWLKSTLIEVETIDNNHPVSGLELEHRRKLSQLCGVIREAPGIHYRVEDLAAQFGCTPDHFTRLFRQHIGVTPIEFLMRTRTHQACDLLTFSELGVGVIAERLGYRDVYFFSRQFKQRVGVSPAVYRRHLRNV